MAVCTAALSLICVQTCETEIRRERISTTVEYGSLSRRCLKLTKPSRTPCRQSLWPWPSTKFAKKLTVIQACSSPADATVASYVRSCSSSTSLAVCLSAGACFVKSILIVWSTLAERLVYADPTAMTCLPCLRRRCASGAKSPSFVTRTNVSTSAEPFWFMISMASMQRAMSLAFFFFVGVHIMRVSMPFATAACFHPSPSSEKSP
mmetsp:Transcript_21033/g.71241  ORF Transcript_21033/g.71241 Transcript_21033/m.71241 type:complete len:206 (+) Transcript_21033:157-774(+)